MSEALREAIKTYDAIADSIGSCGDGGCLVKRPVGMHTNGGCRCSDERLKAQRMMRAGAILRAALSKAGND